MNITGTLSVGPLSVPAVVAWIAGILALSYFAGLVRLRNNKPARRAYSDIFLTPLLPFLLAWKLSLLITDAADVFRNPISVLYSSGSVLNIVIGLVIAGLFTFRHWLKVNKEVRKGLLTAFLTGLLLAGILLLFGNQIGRDETGSPGRSVEITDEFGQMKTLGTPAGKPVIINFWASWCPPCRAEMPMFNSLITDPELSDAIFFFVNAAATEKNPEQGRVWLEENGLNLPLYFDTRGAAMAAFGIEVLPTTIILDARGNTIARKTGTVSRNWVLSGFRKAKRNG